VGEGDKRGGAALAGVGFDKTIRSGIDRQNLISEYKNIKNK
jgi:hypothetical protein